MNSANPCPRRKSLAPGKGGGRLAGTAPAERVIPLKGRDRGAALVIVLLLITVFSVILAEFLYEQRINAAVLHNREERLKTRYVARAGQLASEGLIRWIRPDDDRFNNEMVQLFRYSCLTPPGGVFSTGLFMSEPSESEITPPEAASGGTARLQQLEGCGRWSLAIPYVLDEIPIDIEIQDEQARLNLNAILTPIRAPAGAAETDYMQYTVNKSMLNVLYELFRYQAFKHNIEISELDLHYMLFTLLVDYIDHDIVDGGFDKDEFSAFEYEDSDEIVPMKNAWLDSVDEIKYLPGMTPELFDAVKDFLTVYPMDFNGDRYLTQVNLNAAPIEVLYALFRGTTYEHDEPTISEDEAWQMAEEMVRTAYYGSEQGTSSSSGSGIFIPQKNRILPPRMRANSILNAQFKMHPDQTPRYWRIISTATTEDGLQTTITRVVKFHRTTGVTVLFYKEE